MWGLALAVMKMLGKLQGLRPICQLFCGLWVFLSYLLAGQKLGIHTLSTAKSMNYPVGALSLCDMRELWSRCKSDKQLLCVIILSWVPI